MSKELTEQWKNGTLPENWYYIHLKSEWGGIDFITINYCDEDGVFEEYPDEDIKEVLAPVPTYDQFVDTSKKIDELKQQLKDANNVIMFYSNADEMSDEERQMTSEKYHLVYGLKANDYLEKYGVEK